MRKQKQGQRFSGVPFFSVALRFPQFRRKRLGDFYNNFIRAVYIGLKTLDMHFGGIVDFPSRKSVPEFVKTAQRVALLQNIIGEFVEFGTEFAKTVKQHDKTAYLFHIRNQGFAIDIFAVFGFKRMSFAQPVYERNDALIHIARKICVA